MRSGLVNSVYYLLTMSTFLYTLLGLSVGTSLHCAVRKEISPCTCRREEGSSNKIFVTCEKMSSFGEVVDALQNRFPIETNIVLEVTFSNLEDLNSRNFQELKTSITNLKLTHDNIRELSEDTFSGLGRVNFLSLADNALSAVPRNIFSRIPKLGTLDIGRGKIRHIHKDDFKNATKLEHIFLPGNQITIIERNSLPSCIQQLHIGRNQITNLNGTVRQMTNLVFLFINSNQITSLDGELPEEAPNLLMIHASENLLTHLPQDLKKYPNIQVLFFENNLLTSLDGALSKARKLDRLNLSRNKIRTITPEDFTEADSLVTLLLDNNRIKAINGSLLPLRYLRLVNLSSNALTEFSLNEIKNLRRLRTVDLSYNQISKLVGQMDNVIDMDTRVMELRLEHNLLQSLGGALSGLRGLLNLNLSNNRLTHISPDDFINLDELKILDISYNKITTLNEFSKTALPALEELLVSYNMLTMLDNDFHGLENLCRADLSYNRIQAISRDLVARTRCNIHGSPATLRLYLQDNPILCDTALPELISDFEVNNTRIEGEASCKSITTIPLEVVDNVSNTGQAIPISEETLAKSLYKADDKVVEYVQQTTLVPLQQQQDEQAPNNNLDNNMHKEEIVIITETAIQVESIE